MIDVVAAIIKDKNNRVLIARKKKGKSLEGLWEFPGGKIEAGESPEESLIREIKEEMDIQIKVLEYFGENVYGYESITVRLIAYIAEMQNGHIKLKDHDMYKWASVDELETFPIAPADILFVEKLKNYHYFH